MRGLFRAAAVTVLAGGLGACATVSTPGSRGASAFSTGTNDSCVTGGGINLGVVGVSAAHFNQSCANQKLARNLIDRPEKTSVAMGVAFMRKESREFMKASDAVHDAATRKVSMAECVAVQNNAKTNKVEFRCSEPAMTFAK